MQKTLTLYPKYITSGSNFTGILSSNETGEDYRTIGIKDDVNVGTIAFDTSVLHGKSAACLLNQYSVSYDQRVSYNTGGDELRWELTPYKLTSYSVDASSVTVHKSEQFGNVIKSYTNGDKYINKGGTFFQGEQLDTDLFGGITLLGFYLYGANNSYIKFKLYMRNLRADVVYTARYYARFFSEDEKLIATQTVDGGNAPVITEEILNACRKEGYRIIGWKANDSVTYSSLPVCEDTDIEFRPVYERIFFRVTAPNKNGGTWQFRTFYETYRVWIDNESKIIGDKCYCDVEYGKKFKIDSLGFINSSEDLKVVINGLERIFDGSNGNVFVAFETEKLTQNVTISSVEAVPVYFSINTESNAGGTVTPSFRTLRKSQYTVSVTPDTGYEISTIMKDGAAIAIADKSGINITETAVADSRYSIRFSKIKIPITINHDEGVSVSGETSIDYGRYGTWTVSANDGYSIDTVKVNGEKIADFFKRQSSYTFQRPCISPIAIDITSSNNLVTITALECENGEISGDIGSFIKGKGTLKLFARPERSYSFESWVGADWTSQSVTIDSATADDSYTVSATFKKYACKVSAGFLKSFHIGWHGDEFTRGATVEIIDANDVSEIFGVIEGYAESGSDVTFTVHPEDGFEVKRISWTIEGQKYSSSQRTVTFENIISDRSISIEIAQKKINVTFITESPDGKLTGGTFFGTRREITQEFTYGNATTYEAIPDEGYYFVKWSDDIYTAKRDYLIPPYDETITAYFKRYEYDIEVSAEEHGKISLTTDGTIYENKATAKHFDDVTMLITPNFGWKVSDVLLDGDSIKEQVTITLRDARFVLKGVTEAHSFEVKFEPKIYTNGRKLIDYYPPVIAAIKDMQEITAAQQPLIDELWNGVSFVTENQFIETSTEEGVKEWEDELGIVSSALDTFEQRKKRLKNRWVPDNRFTMPWLWEWLKRVAERDDLKEPSVKDYVLTIRLPAIVDFLSIFKDLELYKPANIGINAEISLEDGVHNLTAGVGLATTIKATIESEVEANENQTDE